MFDNPLLLAGLGGAVLPLVIHLLARARYRTVDWGAMMFIAPPGTRWSQGARLREIALLLVRMAAVALLAVALARPTGPAARASVETQSRVAAAIVVDCSASMSFEDVAGSRMDRAREAVLRVLSTLRRGDRVALVPADARQSPRPQMTGDLQSIATRAGELRPTAGAVNLLSAIDTARALLLEQERGDRRLYVVCDRQAMNWRSALSAPGRGAVAGLAGDPAAPDRFPFLLGTVGGHESDNVSIEEMELINPPAVSGNPAQVAVRIRNHGAAPVVGLPLTLRLGPREVLSTTITAPAGQSRAVVADVTFPTTGPAVLSADLKSDGAALDDHGDLVVDVSAPLRTLIVTSDAQSRDAATLRAALTPYASLGERGPDLASVSVVWAGGWDASDLSSWQVLVLHDMPAPNEAQAVAIARFVFAGGGLLLAPGPSTQINAYNQLLYREDGGVLPALLQPSIAPIPRAGIEPATLETSHPMLAFLDGRTASVAVDVERFIPTTARTPAAHALASLTTGDALLLESSYGRGRVLLVTSSLGGSWSSMPMTSLYLPLVQSAARYLAGASTVDRNVPAGTELTAIFDPPVAGSRGVVIRPDDTRDTSDLATIDQRTEARYGRTDLAGLYTIRVGPRGQERSVVFSVAPPAAESDLTPLEDAQWNPLERDIGFARIDADAGELATRLSGARPAGGQYWLWVLAAVVALLIAELALARRWSRD